MQYNDLQKKLMKKFIFSILIGFGSVLTFAENDSTITLNEIWEDYSYFPKSAPTFNWFSDTAYTVLKGKKGVQAILKYGVSGQKIIDTLFSIKNHTSAQSSESLKRKINDYKFNQDQSIILILNNKKNLYRHSTSYSAYVVGIETDYFTYIPRDKIFNPQFSPDGKHLAYSSENNLFIFNLEKKKETQITFDGQWNKIINGRADWVYEEEFSFTQAYEWSPSGKKIAFLRFNESEVKEYNMQVWSNPLYPKDYRFKYPKAGEKNAQVNLLCYDLNTKNIKAIYEGQDDYIPRIYWMNDNTISYQWLNRQQNNWKLIHHNLSNSKEKLVSEEKNKTYVEVSDIHYSKESLFYTSEKSGFNHIYNYTFKTGKSIQITNGKWEISHINFVDEKQNRIYYTSTEFSSMERHPFKIDFQGNKKICLNPLPGTHRIQTNGTYVLDFFSSSTEPKIVSLLDKEGNRIKVLQNNGNLKNKLAQKEIAIPEFTSYPINGENLNAFVLKPVNFDATKKYPVLMFIYGGPGIQTVKNSWLGPNYLWYQILLQKGYIIVSVDGRGTGGKGANFKKSTYGNLGGYESDDQIAVAKQLAKLSYIDSSRIGIWGWSFGGYLSSLCLMKANDVFKMAIAVAPVTSWRFYDSIYTERYLNTPQLNSEGYDKNSPITYADKLKGSFLLVHGTGDDNVHIQNSLKLQEALIKSNKQFTSFFYPDKNHGIYGGNTRLHLYQMMTDFIVKEL